MLLISLSISKNIRTDIDIHTTSTYSTSSMYIRMYD